MAKLHNFFEEINGVGVNFYELTASDSEVVNIFLHGFTTVCKEADLENIKRSIAINFQNATNILIHWDSGKISPKVAATHTGTSVPAGTSTVTTILAAMRPVKKMMPACKTLWDKILFRTPKEIATVAPAGLTLAGAGVAVSAGAAAVAVSTAAYVAYFKNKEILAHKLSISFKSLLNNALKNRNYTRLNLFGHSLGARIIVNALAHDNYDCSKVVLMGGAVPWPENGLLSLKNYSNLRLYNFYMEDDLALKCKPDLEKCIGRHKIPEGKNIFNICFEGKEHDEYWSHLDEIAQKIGS